MFNKTLLSIQVTVERGFGIPKTYCCLLKKLNAELDNISVIVVICVVFHNLSQMNGDNCLDQDDILQNILRLERELHQRRQGNERANSLANVDALKDYVNENYEICKCDKICYSF